MRDQILEVMKANPNDPNRATSLVFDLVKTRFRTSPNSEVTPRIKDQIYQSVKGQTIRRITKNSPFSFYVTMAAIMDMKEDGILEIRNNCVHKK